MDTLRRKLSQLRGKFENVRECPRTYGFSERSQEFKPIVLAMSDTVELRGIYGFFWNNTLVFNANYLLYRIALKVWTCL